MEEGVESAAGIPPPLGQAAPVAGREPGGQGLGLPDPGRGQGTAAGLPERVVIGQPGDEGPDGAAPRRETPEGRLVPVEITPEAAPSPAS